MKTLERLVTKYLMRVIYILSSIMPIKKRVVFATYRTLELEDNFKYIYDEIKKQNLDYECKCLFKKVDPGTYRKSEVFVPYDESYLLYGNFRVFFN